MKNSKSKKLEPIEYSKKERLIMALMTSLAVSFTYFIYGPIDIFANNKTELAINLSDFILPQLLVFLVFFIVISTAIFLFKSYLLNIITAGIISLFISGALDNNLFNKVTYVSGDATPFDVKHGTVFFATYIIIFYATAMASVLLKKQWKKILAYLCVLLFVTNSAALVSDFVTKDITKKDTLNCDYVASKKNLYSVSDKENIIYILFDRMDTKYYDVVTKNRPGFFDDMEGFTYYDSATTSYSKTFPAVTSLITGNLYYLDKTPNEYFDYAYSNSAILSDLKANGYSVNLYIDRYYEYNDATALKDIADNVEAVTGYVPDSLGACKYLTKLSVERNFSYVRANSFLYNAGTGTTATLSDFECADGMFHDNDAEYYKELCNNGLSSSGADKNYTFLYLHGSHAPHTLDENCQKSKDATVETQTVGAFKIVFEYLEQLKKLGVYDNSTIIIAADHGYAYSDYYDYFDVANSGITACVFVKPRNAKNKKLITSSAPISVTNIIPTIVSDAKLKTNNSYGKSVFDIKEGDSQKRTLYQCAYTNDVKFSLNEYEINGDAKDLNNWKLKQKIKSDYAWY